MSKTASIPKRINNITGRSFAGWMVVGFSRRVIATARVLDYWLVECDVCGFRREAQGAKLKGDSVAVCSHVPAIPVAAMRLPQFKPITQATGYWVCVDGSVWSCHVAGGTGGLSGNCRKLAPRADKDGYLSVTVRTERGHPRTVKVAHLVLEAFSGPRPQGAEAMHFPDRDILNNSADNLC